MPYQIIGKQFVVSGSSGNVGIGTTSPQTKLDVVSTVRTSRAENNQYYSDFITNYNDVTTTQITTQGTAVFQAGSTDSTVITAKGTNKHIILTPNGTGGVGIGTTSPEAKLDINGNNTTLNLIQDYTAYSYGDTKIFMGHRLSGGDNVTIRHDSAYADLYIDNNYDAQGGTYGRIWLRQNISNTMTTVVSVRDQKVGIGTTSPTTKLDVTAGGAQGLALGQDLNNSALSSRLFFSSSGAAVSLYSGGSLLYFNTGATIGTTSGTTRVIFNANGIGLGGSSSTSGTGIKFPSTQDASSDVNVLDDYEEGTYTPTLTTTTGTPTYTFQEGYYTKIGRQVFGGGIIGISNSTSLTGAIRISIPFTASAGSYSYASGFTSDGSGWTFPVTSNGFYSVTLQINDNEANLYFIGVGTNAALVNYNSSGIADSWYIRFGFSYRT